MKYIQTKTKLNPNLTQTVPVSKFLFEETRSTHVDTQATRALNLVNGLLTYLVEKDLITEAELKDILAATIPLYKYHSLRIVNELQEEDPRTTKR